MAVVDAGHAFWNAAWPSDVNADNVLAPSDAMVVINALNSVGPHQLSDDASGEGETGGQTLFVDTNNDGRLTPSDALQVINALNSGEGELGPPQAEDKMQIVVRARLPNTNSPLPNNTINVGQDYDLQIEVKDLRPQGAAKARGVASSYMDLLYSKALSQFRVAEIQTISLNPGTADTGTFTLTFNGQTTAPISFDSSTSSPATMAADIQSALGALSTIGGASNITVLAPNAANFAWQVRFVGQYDVDENPISGDVTGLGGAAAGASIAVEETVKGDITNAASFREAFRSRPIPGLTGTPPAPGPLQSGFTADPTAILDQADRVDELGAFFSDQNPTGTNFIELLRVRVKATAVGIETFTPDTINITPGTHDNLLYVDTTTDPPEDALAIPDNLIAATAATITIVQPITTVNDTATVNEDDTAGTTINVLSNDTNNISTTALEVRSFNQPASGGTVTQVGNQLKFVPAADFNGQATFTYVAGIVGDTTNTGTATVTVTVNSVNDAPKIDAINNVTMTEDQQGVVVNLTGISTGAANENQTITITATTPDTTLFASPLPVTYTSGAATGSIALNPIADASGVAHITVTVTDSGDTLNGGVNTTVRTFNVTITAANDAPINQIGTPPAPITAATPNPVAIPDSPFAFTGASALSVKDPDAGATFTVTLTLSGSPDPGTISATGTGVSGSGGKTITITSSKANVDAALATLVYTPTAGFTGTANLQIKSDDGQAQDTDTIGIDVIPPNKPFARGDSLAINEDDVAPHTINVLSNDLTNTGAVATLESFTQPTAGQGAVTLNDNGTPTDKTDDKLVYTAPGNNFNGTVKFTYTINETPATNSNGPSTGTVTVLINPVNDQPVALDDNYSTAIGVPLVVTAQGTPKGVLNNDTDLDVGDTLTAVNAVIAAGQGTVNLLPDGGFTYTPPAGGGDFTFTYQARDNSGAANNTSAAATVHIHVVAPPTANPDTFTAAEDAPFTSPTSVLANDTDTEPGSTLQAVIDSNVPAAAGSVTLNPSGTFTYNPASNFNTTRPPASPITFTYHATAGGRNSNVTTVSITVNESNDVPLTTADGPLTVVKRNGQIGVDQPLDVLANDKVTVAQGNVDSNEVFKVTSLTAAGGTVTADAVTGNSAAVATTAGGSVKLSNFQVLYTSPAAEGADSFTYKASDFDATSGAARGGISADTTVTLTVTAFIPHSVGGSVYLDNNGNGLIDAAETTDNNHNGVLDPAEKRLAGVVVTLSGKDFLGNNVSLTATTDANGNYVFPQVAGQPGVLDTNPAHQLSPPATGTDYTVTETPPPYLLSGIDAVTGNNGQVVITNLDPRDNKILLRWDLLESTGAVRGLNFGVGGINAGALTNSAGLMQEFFATSGSNGFVICADLSGNNLWHWSLPGWDNATDASVTLDPSFAFLTLHLTIGGTKYDMRLTQGYIRDPGNNAILSTARFRVLGIGQNGQYIIRIDGSYDGATDGVKNFLQVASTGAPAAGGEGEAAASGNYANSADAVFAEQAWA